jgi:hypothetical protein
MKKILFILAAVLLLGALIWWVIQTPSPVTSYKQVVILEQNDLINTTEYTYLDTALNVGMNELGMKGVRVLIQPMQDRIRNKFEESEGIELKAYVAEWMDGYTLCVNGDLGRVQAIDVIAHEIIHLEQYHNQDLIVGDGPVVLWMEERYDVLGIPYAERPWERDAFSRQKDLAKKMRSQLLE